MSIYYKPDIAETTMENIANIDFITKVDVPGWANMDKGYHPVVAERVGHGGSYPMVVTYAPNSTLGIGFKRVFIVENSTKKPFHKMKEMWNELGIMIKENAKSKNSSFKNSSSSHLSPSINIIYDVTSFPNGYGSPDNITISENGELRSAFGVPSTSDIYGIIWEIALMYNDWRKFPNEPNFRSIENLKEAVDKISRMQMDAKELEGEIDESRRLIKEHQDRIAKLEGKMNKLYEDGADAMNLLEEHGVKIDNDFNVQFDGDSEELDTTMINPFMNYYGSQYITISQNDGSTLTYSNDYPIHSMNKYTVSGY